MSELAPKLAESVLSGDEFFVSVLTHFQVLWGDRMAGIGATKYESFVSKLGIGIAPLTEEDAALASRMKPARNDLVGSLICATVARYDATMWTRDKDFLRYLPKEIVKML